MISKLGSLCIFSLALIMLLGCTPKKEPHIRIATAASMHYTMQELSKVFTLQTGIPCDIITGSSGKLSTQILQGAPYDIFVAADMDYPNTLFQNKKTVVPPKIYAYGELVLWTTTSDVAPSLQILSLPEIKHIALANPKTAPYGRSAIEVLEKLNLLDRISYKLVYGESVAQASQFIFSQAADIGFTAKSVVMAPNTENKGKWTTINQQLYTPIAQGLVVLQNKEQQEEIQQFYNFLFSDAATAILNTFGYSRTKP